MIGIDPININVHRIVNKKANKRNIPKFTEGEYLAVEASRDRYDVLVSTVEDNLAVNVSNEVRDNDKKEYSHLIETHNGLPVIDVMAQLDFMEKVSGIERRLCAAFLYIEEIELCSCGMLFTVEKRMTKRQEKEVAEKILEHLAEEYWLISDYIK